MARQTGHQGSDPLLGLPYQFSRAGLGLDLFVRFTQRLTPKVSEGIVDVAPAQIDADNVTERGVQPHALTAVAELHHPFLDARSQLGAHRRELEPEQTSQLRRR